MYQSRTRRPAAEQDALHSKPSAAGMRLPAVSPLQKTHDAPVQRKIHVKSGEKFDGVSKGVTAPKLKAIANSSAIYLVRSMDDVNAMKLQQDVPVLGPKKHLIGESHSASQFTTAVTDWSWGAELLIEAYSQHETLGSPKQDEKKQASANKNGAEDIMYATAKGLENTAVRGLTDLVNAQIFGKDLLQMARNNQKSGEFDKLDKQQFKTFCENTWQKWSAAIGVVRALIQYLTDSKKSQEAFWGSYFKEHVFIKSIVTLPLYNKMRDGIDNIIDQTEDLDNSRLDPALLANFLNGTDELIPALRRLIVAYDPKGFTLNQIKDMDEEAFNSDDIKELDPLRERYMKKNIEAAPVPTLVKIGSNHVTHLLQDLPAKTEGHMNYAAFANKNMANNVEV
jgi:hypothetical protein